VGNAPRPLPRVFRVADGLLLLCDQPLPTAVAGPVRLRALADHLFLPADAELVPALLDDEARGLVREQGLVFLPHGRVLSFDPARPLDLSTLLATGDRRRREWRPLPEVPELPDRVR